MLTRCPALLWRSCCLASSREPTPRYRWDSRPRSSPRFQHTLSPPLKVFTRVIEYLLCRSNPRFPACWLSRRCVTRIPQAISKSDVETCAYPPTALRHQIGDLVLDLVGRIPRVTKETFSLDRSVAANLPDVARPDLGIPTLFVVE